MSSILSQILADKRKEVEERKRAVSLQEVESRAQTAGGVRGFLSQLRRFAPVALIAEVKRASPSKGIIVEDFQPVEIAQAYERGGAACISVLTDENYFCGSLSDLAMVRNAVRLPVLRKDFIVDDYQIYESRAAGADCILLIAAALEPDVLIHLFTTAQKLNLDVLLEVHDESEMESAATMRAPLIGINNRNLATFETNLHVTERLAPLAPRESLLVSESGIWTPQHVRRVAAAGASAVLVGESLEKSADIERATRELLAI